MTDKKLEKLFLDFADASEALEVKNKIRNKLFSSAKPTLRLLLPAMAVAIFAVVIIFYTQSGAHKAEYAMKRQNVSVYDSPMYVYLINSIYEGE
ncbi:MAG: hypothetical protein LBM71_01885 [Elusimicrobiota bacterium]|jgi:hypothetical protein|nr:hypothetical protein [Elusimicrobiota bacterium]